MVEAKKRARKRKDDHITVGGKGFRCQRCGTELELPYNQGGSSVMAPRDGGFQPEWRPSHGISIRVMEVYRKEFTSKHLRCKADDPRGKARYTYANPEEWIGSWDTGISSLAIYGIFKEKNLLRLLGGQPPHGPPVPYDPADFGRCYRLLRAAPPEWTSGLQKVADKHPAWQPFVDRWGELALLYEEELPTGECPKLYEVMQGLVKKAEA